MPRGNPLSESTGMEVLTSTGPSPLDYIGALKLAIEAGANVEAVYALVGQILDDAPDPNSSATWPTKILVEAIQELQATVSVP